MDRGLIPCRLPLPLQDIKRRHSLGMLAAVASADATGGGVSSSSSAGPSVVDTLTSTPPSDLPVDPPSISLNLSGVPHRKVPLPYGPTAAAVTVSVPLLQLQAGSHVRVTVGNGGKRAAAVAAVGYGGGTDGYGVGTGSRTHYPSWLEVRAVP